MRRTKGGRAMPQEAGAQIHTHLLPNAGGDGRMCATCEEFVVFTRCSALIAPRAHCSCSAAAFVAAEVS